jgi:hypothetical protein
METTLNPQEEKLAGNIGRLEYLRTMFQTDKEIYGENNHITPHMRKVLDEVIESLDGLLKELNR